MTTPGHSSSDPPRTAILAVHGGSGTTPRNELSAARERDIRETLEAALLRGSDVLARGGTSLDAVEASIRILEDSPEFNAGRGAVFTSNGRNELDASIMDGRSLAAGAVAEVTVVKNPISAARRVLESSPHVMLVGAGADLFARESGLEIVDPSYFRTDHRWEQLQAAISREKSGDAPWFPSRGTVGAVALDLHGHLAAGTSTGGMTNKRWGRIGDSPVIGAGTYANDATCAVSCTGHGEYFLRFVAAHDVSALVEYRGLTVGEAADEVIHRKLAPAGGMGGLIALDRHGRLAMPFSSEGMYRGSVDSDGRPNVAIWSD